MTSFVGTHPTGRRYYAKAKHDGIALVFAVFTRRSVNERWETHAANLIEDRPYEGQMHRVLGSYRPFDGSMTPRQKAEAVAEWYQSCCRQETQIIELRPTMAAKRQGVPHCPRCVRPAHASESNDDGVCRACLGSAAVLP